MSKDEKTNRRPKIQVQMSEELNDRITKTSAEIGMSKSAFCAFIIGNYFLQKDSVEESLKNVVEEAISKAKDSQE